MPTPSSKINDMHEIRIGTTAALQPISGVRFVNTAYAVNGMGRVGYVRKEDTEKTSGRP